MASTSTGIYTYCHTLSLPDALPILLDLGANDGVAFGQAFIDASGLLGQVTAVAPDHATALLVTDPDHAVPVQVVRSGLRVIAYGTGERDRLEVRDIPQSGDIREGDALITSGIGGNFPDGFAVGAEIGRASGRERVCQSC